MSGSVLREAAAQGDVEYLKELLETGGNPCSTDDNGLNALHFAVWNGHVDAVELLVVNDVGCKKSISRPGPRVAPLQVYH